MRYAVLVALSLLCGCGTGYRSCASWAGVSVRQPTFIVGAGWATNRPNESARSATKTQLHVLPNNNAPVMIYGEQIIVMVGGGTATSNSVLSGIQVPVTP